MANFFSLDSLFDETGSIPGAPDSGETASEKYSNRLRELFERWKSNKVVSDVMSGNTTFYETFKNIYGQHLQSEDLDNCLGRIRTATDRAKTMKDVAIGAGSLGLLSGVMGGIALTGPDDKNPDGSHTRRFFLKHLAAYVGTMIAGGSSMLALGAANSNESILEYRAKSLDTMYCYIRK